MPDIPSVPTSSPGAGNQAERAKAVWAAKIEQHINQGEYTGARELVKQALAEFPNDLGLRGLDSLAEHGLRRSQEAGILLRQGRKLIEENQFEGGVEVLRRAWRLDERNPETRAALSGALAGRARSLMATDRATADAYVREALTIQPDNPIALSLSALLSDYKQKEVSPLQPVPIVPLEGTKPSTVLVPLAPVAVSKPKPVRKVGVVSIVVGVAAVVVIVAATIAAFLLSRPQPHSEQAKRIPPVQSTPATQTATVPPATTFPTPPPEPAPVQPGSAPELAATTETLPLIVTANVADAVVVINNRELKTHLANGRLLVRRPPGKYQVLVKADDYEPATAQIVELKSGAMSAPVNFNLNRVAHAATILVESAPTDSEILLDGASIGTATSGTFRKDVSPGSHTITVRKPDYVDLVHYQQFSAGQTETINAADMKAFGKLQAKVTPATAHVTYKRAGDTEAKALPPNGAASLPPGDYILESKADGFLPDLQNITVPSGREAVYAATLHPTVVAVEKMTPQKIFANGPAWTFTDPDSWWTYSQKGFSFARRDEGTLNFTLARDTKPFMKDRVKKYEFVADYKDEDNKILYSLDAHHLTKKVYVDGKEIKQDRSDVSIDAGDAFHLSVQLLPDTVTVKINGAADSTKRPQIHGKFGFINEVVLTPR